MKSNIKNKKDINWNKTIVIDKLLTTEKNLNQYKEQVNNSILNLDDNEKNQQISFLVIRENILNQAMNYLFSFYGFNIDQNDIASLKQNKNNNSEDFNENDIINQIKIDLIFNDIKNTYNINVNDTEVSDILNKYGYNDIDTNDTNFVKTKKTLEKEKIINFIIKKFKIDTSKLEQNLYQSLSNLEHKN